MRLFAVLMIVALVAPGCMWMEQAAKAGAAGALNILNEKIPVLTETMKNEINAKVGEGIEKLGVWAAEKADAQGTKMAKWIIRQADLDPMAFDFNGDGKLDETEIGIGLDRAKESGAWPWWLQLIAAFGGTGALFTSLKSTKRYLAARRTAEIKTVVNGGAPDGTDKT